MNKWDIYTAEPEHIEMADDAMQPWSVFCGNRPAGVILQDIVQMHLQHVADACAAMGFSEGDASLIITDIPGSALALLDFNAPLRQTRTVRIITRDFAEQLTALMTSQNTGTVLMAFLQSLDQPPVVLH